MAVTQILQFTTNSPVNDNPIEDGQGPKHFTIGTHIQDPSAVQVTAEWEGVHDYTAFKNTPEYASFVGRFHKALGQPNDIYHTAFNIGSAFSNSGPTTANVVEFVQNWFPASKITPDFQKQIEADFAKFWEILNSDGPAPGGGVVAHGWSLEEQAHPDIVGEKAKCFVVIRGWDSMADFQQAVQTKAFTRAIPVLLAWSAPYKMWHVQQHKISS